MWRAGRWRSIRILRNDPARGRAIYPADLIAFEIRFGLERLTAGARRLRLEASFARVLLEELGERVLDLDRPAVDATAVLLAARRKAGQGIEVRDGMICGIALARRAAIATGNVRHFEGTGVAVVNPWERQ